MKKIIVFALLLQSLLLHAQDPYKYGSFVIQGKVKGYTEPTFDFGLTSFFGNVRNSVVVRPDGTFRQSFPVQYLQEIYFLLNGDAMPFTVYDGDTLKLEWDNTDFQKTFSITGKNKNRTKELAIERARYWHALRGLRQLLESLSKQDQKPDLAKITLSVNDFYNREVQTILDSAGGSITPHVNYLITGAYFRYLELMKSMSRRSEQPSRPILKLDGKKTYPSFWIADTINAPAPYRTLREDWWLKVPEYRDYLFDYVRIGTPVNGRLFDSPRTSLSQPPPQTGTVTGQAVVVDSEEANLLLSSFTYKDIQNGNKHLSITPIREWFQTEAVMFGFGYYSFAETEQAYHTIKGNFTSAYLRDTLQKFYNDKLRLKPGQPAPAFTLLDEKGKHVSLADFRGKVVYIDFWGVGCGPCIYEIKNHVPDLQKRYADKNVVFLNICVDAKGKEWTDALFKYKLTGVNLFADGWTENRVCKDYNVSGIPHHVLIDKAGIIVDNNAPEASELLQSARENAIDVLLK